MSLFRSALCGRESLMALLIFKLPIPYTNAIHSVESVYLTKDNCTIPLLSLSMATATATNWAICIMDGQQKAATWLTSMGHASSRERTMHRQAAANTIPFRSTKRGDSMEKGKRGEMMEAFTLVATTTATELRERRLKCKMIALSNSFRSNMMKKGSSRLRKKKLEKALRIYEANFYYLYCL